MFLYSVTKSRISEKAKLFPNYDDLFTQLQNYADKVHSEIEYSAGYNQFTNGKKSVIYILLPFANNYSEAVLSRDGELLFNFDVPLKASHLSTSKSTLFVFLAEGSGKYWIVGWNTQAELFANRITEDFAKYGDHDVSYQMKSEFKTLCMLPVSTCTYKIESSDMCSDFKKNKCCQYEIDDPTIALDMDYINSYCEGYLSIGFDPKNISSIPAYKDLTVSQMKKLKMSGYSAVWNANAIVDKEPSPDNLLYRANTKRNAWLNASAYEDYKRVLKIQPDNTLCAAELIKLCAILSLNQEGITYIKQYKELLPHDDTSLSAAISLLSR